MDHLYHGYVSHNQRVNPHVCLLNPRSPPRCTHLGFDTVRHPFWQVFLASLNAATSSGGRITIAIVVSRLQDLHMTHMTWLKNCGDTPGYSLTRSNHSPHRKRKKKKLRSWDPAPSHEPLNHFDESLSST